MKRHVSASFLILSVLVGIELSGCKVASPPGLAMSPTLTFSEATNASLQAAHKFGMDIAASVQSGSLSLTPTEKSAFDTFVKSLNATDALFIAYSNGKATQAQVAASLSNTASKQVAAQTALAGRN